MKKNRIILIVIGTFFLVSAITMISYTSLFTPLDSATIRTNATVVNGHLVGFNLDTTVLSFGQVPQGGMGRRYVDLANLRNMPVRVKATAQGNISPYLYINQSSFTLQAYETSNYSITFEPTAAEYGYYEGTITFTYYRKPFLSKN